MAEQSRPVGMVLGGYGQRRPEAAEPGDLVGIEPGCLFAAQTGHFAWPCR